MADAKVQALEMRLAYLTSQYPATSHTFISREVAAVREAGVSVETFSIRPPTQNELQDEVLRKEAEDTFTVLREPLTSFLAAQIALLSTRPAVYFRTLGRALRHRPPGVRGFAMAFVYFAEALVLARELKRRSITRLHNHFANAGAIVGYLAAGLLDMPWSFTMHGISETDYPAGLLLARKIDGGGFRGLRVLLWAGAGDAPRFARPLGQAARRALRPTPCHLPKRSGKHGGKRIICVGRLSAEKGQAGLLEAFAGIAARSPEAELVLVGDGPEAEDLRSRSQLLGIAGKVTFAGRLGEQETLERIAASDILVLPSFMEGLPIVLMEAMALGTAVIASRVAGIPELVEDGKTGLLFTPSKWDELAACMLRLLGDDELRKILAQNGKTTVGAEFDIKSSANQLRALFSGSCTK